MAELSMPTPSAAPTVPGTGPLLQLDDLAVHYAVAGRLGTGRRMLKAVDGIDLDVRPGECLGLVGESGCGKSTLALAIMGLVPPTRGHVRIAGQDIGASDRPDRKAMARTVQMVFQDPYASLNPRQTVRARLPIRGVGARPRSAPVAEMLAWVGLRPGTCRPHPHRRGQLRIGTPGADPSPSSSATSRCRRSTSRSAPRSSTCCWS
jgi:ABC-type glutathione transport system ATPase component